MKSAFETTRVFPAEKKDAAGKKPPEPAWETVIRGEALYPFGDVEIGGMYTRPEAAKNFTPETGGLRADR